MCGIHAILSKVLYNASPEYRKQLHKLYHSAHCNLALRGPEDNKTVHVNDFLTLSFYRLAINGLTTKGMQPFNLPEYPHVHVICNGEIYNHIELENQIGYHNKSGSDCEVIAPLFTKFGFAQTVKLLDGVFGLAIWDENDSILWIARDRFGVRPLFLTRDICPKTGQVVAYQIASELKAMRLESDFTPGTTLKAVQFLPGCFAGYKFHKNTETITQVVDDRYFTTHWPRNPTLKLNDCLTGVNRLLRRAVAKRLMSERPIGCLLSGGLDSSLVASIVAEEMREFGRRPNTFSIGFAGSSDLAFARKVADHIGSEHHEFVLDPQEFLNAIDHVIYITETWDTTSVRASVGNYLVAKKIAEYNKSQEFFEHKVVVIFNGDGSDEVAGGYLYHHRKAPSMLEFHAECERLLTEINYFDVLRSDRTICDNGLEARTPFLDPDFVGFYLSIPVQFRGDKSKPEKWLLREAFKNDNLLPEEVLNRTKEAFSDGVSGQEKSWWEIIQEWVLDKKMQKDAILSLVGADSSGKSKTVLPQSIEAAYYRLQFNKFYPGQSQVIPHYWLPRWSGNVINPSARVLDVYEHTKSSPKTTAGAAAVAAK